LERRSGCSHCIAHRPQGSCPPVPPPPRHPSEPCFRPPPLRSVDLRSPRPVPEVI
jgi:hypothetical protein